MSSPTPKEPRPTPHAHASAVSKLSIIALASPFVGLLVEMALAARFGAGAVVDAFRIAILFLYIFSQLFITNVLPNIIIPFFSTFMAENRRSDAFHFAASLALFSCLLSAIVVCLAWWRAEALIDLFGPGLTGEGREKSFHFFRFFSLSLMALSLVGVINAILQFYRVFWVLPVSQIANNAILFASIAFLEPVIGDRGLVVGVLGGAGAMLLFHLVYLIKTLTAQRIQAGFVFNFGPAPELRKAVSLSLPLVAMVIVGSWSAIVTNRTLSLLDVGAVASYGYAWKLLAVLAIIPQSLATVLFPAISDSFASKDREETFRLATKAVRMTLFLTIGFVAVIFPVSGFLVGLALDRGAMEADGLALTMRAFEIMIFSAPAGAMVALLCKFSYSAQDTRAPAAFTIAVALALTLSLPWAAAHGGLELVCWVLNIFIWANALGLMIYLDITYQMFSALALARYAFFVSVMAGVMAGLAEGTKFFWAALFPETAQPLLLAALCLTVATLTGYLLARIFRLPELDIVVTYATWAKNNLVSRIKGERS